MATPGKHKKWITYALGVLVVAVWGIVLQQVFTAAGPSSENLPAPSRNEFNGKAKLPALQADTFTLLLNYRDPFASPEVPATSNVEPVSAGVPKVAPAPAVLPVSPLDEVVYLGYFVNAQTKKRVAILQMAGAEHMVQEKETFKEMEVLNISAEAVAIQHRNKVKRIRIKP